MTMLRRRNRKLSRRPGDARAAAHPPTDVGSSDPVFLEPTQHFSPPSLGFGLAVPRAVVGMKGVRHTGVEGESAGLAVLVAGLVRLLHGGNLIHGYAAISTPRWRVW